MDERTCKKCGSKFNPINFRQTYCFECIVKRRALEKKPRQCLWCKENRIPRRHANSQRFCSTDCMLKYRSAQSLILRKYEFEKAKKLLQYLRENGHLTLEKLQKETEKA